MIALLFSAEGLLGAPPSCPVRETRHTVRGDSMLELFKPMQEIVAQEGYFACHRPVRGEIVLVKLGRLPAPLIKLVQTLPGDRFRLERQGAGYIQLWTTTQPTGQVTQRGATRGGIITKDGGIVQ